MMVAQSLDFTIDVEKNSLFFKLKRLVVLKIKRWISITVSDAIISFIYLLPPMVFLMPLFVNCQFVELKNEKKEAKILPPVPFSKFLAMEPPEDPNLYSCLQTIIDIFSTVEKLHKRFFVNIPITNR
jgi:hypothetical protein